MKKFFAHLVFALAVCSACAQAPSYWETLKAPYGGAPTRMAHCSNGKVYALFYDSTAYCSDDKGLNWYKVFEPSTVPDSGFKQIIVGRKGTLFGQRRVKENQWPKLNEYDLFASFDQCKTWNPITQNDNIYGITEMSDGAWLAIKDSVTTGTPGFSFYHLIVRSVDKGKSWSTISYHVPFIEKAQLITDNFDNLHGLQDDYCSHYSIDGGKTWLTPPLSECEGRTISKKGSIIGIVSGSGIYRYNANEILSSQFISIDSIQNKVYVASVMALSSGRLLLSASVRDPKNNYKWYIYVSDDDGLSWQRSHEQAGYNYLIHNSQDADGTIFCSGHECLLRSNDEGKTWHQSSYALHRGLAYRFFVLNDANWLALTMSGLWESANAGEQWNLVKDFTQKFVQINEYQAGIDNNKICYVRAGDSLYRYNPATKIIQNITPAQGAKGYIGGIAINNKTNTVFVVSNTNTLRSNDGGQTWGLSQQGMMIKKACVLSTGKLLAVFDTIHNPNIGSSIKSQLMYSNDDGLSWQKIALLGDRIDIAVAENDIIFALINFQLYKSIDGGINWAKREGFVQYESLFANTRGQLFGDANSSTWFSNDEGLNWQSTPTTISNQTAYTKVAGTDAQNRLYANAWQYAYKGHIGNLVRTRRSTAEGSYLMGQVNQDADADCSTADAGKGLRHWSVKASGTDDWYALTDSSGRFQMFLDTGNYILTTRPYFPVLWENCTDSTPVSLPNLHDTLYKSLIIKAVSDCPFLTVDVTVPKLKHCFDNWVFVSWRNRGTEISDSAWVDVLLDPRLKMSNTQTGSSFISLGGNAYRFPIGLVLDGYGGSLYFSVNVDCATTSPGETLCVEAHIYPDTLCVENPNWSGAQVQATARCEQDTAVVFEVKNVGIAPTGLLEYFIIEDDVVIMGGKDSYNPGESKSYKIPANGHLNRLEIAQAPGHPFSQNAAAWVEGCGGKTQNSLVNLYFLNDGIPTRDIACTEVLSSFDPNDKQGFPLGYGAQNQIRPGQALEYLIRFQNTGTDTAYFVVLRDTLDQWLDPATIQPLAASHPYTWSVNGQGNVQFVFNNIMLPDSHANVEASQGFVSFQVQQRANVPLGAKIRNQASIYFDFNAPVRTNQTLHTVGIDMLSKIRQPKDDKPVVLDVSPNPFSDKTTFSLREGHFEGHRLTLTDAFGRVVLERQLLDNQYVLEDHRLVSGVYAYRLSNPKGQLIAHGKLMIMASK